jgi:hypothetical protein
MLILGANYFLSRSASLSDDTAMRGSWDVFVSRKLIGVHKS